MIWPRCSPRASAAPPRDLVEWRSLADTLVASAERLVSDVGAIGATGTGEALDLPARAPSTMPPTGPGRSLLSRGPPATSLTPWRPGRSSLPRRSSMAPPRPSCASSKTPGSRAWPSLPGPLLGGTGHPGRSSTSASAAISVPVPDGQGGGEQRRPRRAARRPGAVSRARRPLSLRGSMAWLTGRPRSPRRPTSGSSTTRICASSRSDSTL